MRMQRGFFYRWLKKWWWLRNPVAGGSQSLSEGFLKETEIGGVYCKGIRNTTKHFHSSKVRMETSDSYSGKRETSSTRFASSKSSNWNAGAQVHPTREKCCSESLVARLAAKPSDEMLISLVGNAPNQTFGGTMCCTT
ncbi:cyclic nucleotide gated channel 3 [Striga asiatica]|uniref:Cyclic nucleotide gated channel 3 n=1 Tax=Striga asiatica TaxID=4170 RepID=A0A5A7Q951_STRAF|nr:cyclic nucleotide gated channel 3 [Striga asiatica]